MDSTPRSRSAKDMRRISPIAQKFCSRYNLGDREIQALEELQTTTQSLQKGQDIIEEGRTADRIFILINGWAARYKILADGQRQILNFLLPGDIFGKLLGAMSSNEHAIYALTDVEFACVTPEALETVEANHPNLARAFYWVGVCEWSMMCERLVSIGRRCATARLSHLLLELQARLRATGVSPSDELLLPFTQEILADCLGLTHVHVSRSIKKLRERGLIQYERNRFVLLDPERMAEESGFSESYLDMAITPTTPARILSRRATHPDAPAKYAPD